MSESKLVEVGKVPCEVYSRIVGYLRPTRNWNDGKRQEFGDRVPFRIPDSVFYGGVGMVQDENEREFMLVVRRSVLGIMRWVDKKYEDLKDAPVSVNALYAIVAQWVEMIEQEYGVADPA